MININVWSNQNLAIESKEYRITDRESMIKFIEDLLNCCYYSGETICLESVEIDTEKGKNLYTEINRWH